MGTVVARLVRAEWTKLFTTRVWIGLLLGACVLSGAFAALFTAFAGNQDSGLPPLDSPEYARLAFSIATNATVISVVLGIIGITQEYRHRTATPTFLATPQRGRVVIAKLLAYALVAVPYAVLVCAVTVAVVLVYGNARGNAPELTGENLEVLAFAGLALVVYTLIGVGLGALLKNQVGAIVAALVYLYVVEPLLRSIPATSGAYKWLPGGALEAMTATFQGPDLLEQWQGVLLLLGYGLAAALLGTLLAVRRDVV
ncbi:MULTISPECIES: ABC transporter permease [unclassified Modestobacter]|uniref:ABC transporter permease n=1 Tax=unclassified Modestobacter TaxID=2643866 RepID=UPI0022AA9B63|nr:MULTISPECIES: ABC transporter permease [unclassified Modestobacter]MCZ2823933.1 ABC transporter permease [Modestobacter sp. VKM Ac-2981]MCZ2852178.1 ABC transporter permease [Modestobacter sp. VKM Ac-2982]